MVLISLPLAYLSRFTLLNAVQTKIVQRLKSPDRRGAYCGDSTFAVLEPLNQLPTYRKGFPVHIVLGNQTFFHRQEGPGPHVQTNLLHIHTLGLDGVKNCACKVQTGSWSCYRAPVTCIKSLISLIINSFGLPVQIRRYGNTTAYFQNL